MLTRSRLLACIVVAYLGGCASILGLEPPSNDGGAESGLPAFDGSLPCSLDAQVPDAPPTSWNTFNQYIWDDAGDYAFVFYDLTNLPQTIVPSTASLSMAGGAFDGTNIYLTPSQSNGLILQHAVGKAISEWAAYTPDAGIGYEGAVFDGRYVYFIPHQGTKNMPALALRYDSLGAFGNASSWVTFDTGTLVGADSGTIGRDFSGGVFDGRYLYYIPNNDGTVLRYDTKGVTPDGGPPADAGDAGDAGAGDASIANNGFADPVNWSVFNTLMSNMKADDFRGGVFDGRFLYLVPNRGNIFMRYDTSAKAPNFTNASNWSGFEVDTLANAPTVFNGAVYDGHYVYLIPGNHIAVRFDTAKTFGPTAFTEFDLATVVPELAPEAGTLVYMGGAFDGRYVYYMPSYANGGEALRYDTTAPFTAACAWEAAPVNTLNPQLSAFWGGIFDGQDLFYVPVGQGGHSIVMRYASKTPSSMPPLPAFYGSTF